MNPYDQGYRDALTGTLNPMLADRVTPDGPSDEQVAAYRAGARTARADLMAENDARALARETGLAQSGPVPDWARHLNEARGGLPIPATNEPEKMNTQNVAGQSEPGETESKALVVASKGTAGAFSDPEPGSKRARKAKPVDDNQGTFL